MYKVNGGIDWSRLRGLWVIRQMSDEVHELCCEYIYGGGLVGHLCLSPDFAKKELARKLRFSSSCKPKNSSRRLSVSKLQIRDLPRPVSRALPLGTRSRRRRFGSVRYYPLKPHASMDFFPTNICQPKIPSHSGLRPIDPDRASLSVCDRYLEASARIATCTYCDSM